MPRNRSSGPEAGLLDLISLLPWWACVVLGVLSYLVLHGLAGLPVVVPGSNPAAPGTPLRALWIGAVAAGQYILPLVCGGAAIISAVRRRRRKALLEQVATAGPAAAINAMSWQQFEQLVGAAYRLQGYQVSETGGGGADGGVDLVLTRRGEKFLVQCKQWKAYKVGVAVVRELYGLMAAQGAAGGFVVTAGQFTQEAIDFASGRNVELVDGPKLHDLLRPVQAGAGAGSSPQTAATSAQPHPRVPTNAPNCPKCGRHMIVRTARKGANAGGEFWGCTAYPSCKGTLARV